MGGMAALEWSLLFGNDYVQSMVVIATAARQSAWGAAWAENQRCTIRCDPKFRGGHYDLDDPPTSGLAAARMAALLTYRTHYSFEKRFGRRSMSDAACLSQSYLQYQGNKFNARFDANCYLHILDKIDSHDITRNRCPLNMPKDEAIKQVLAQIRQPTLVIGIATDGLYPVSEQYALYENIPNAAFVQLHSEDGHDGFLLEPAQLNELLRSFFGV
jgi:homoserine O-acetyltransferase